MASLGFELGRVSQRGESFITSQASEIVNSFRQFSCETYGAIAMLDRSIAVLIGTPASFRSE